MKKYTSIVAASSVSLLFSACDKPEATSSSEHKEPRTEDVDSSAQDKLISEQAARIRELEEQERLNQEARIKELERRERELRESIAEHKRLAEAETSTPVLVDPPVSKAIEVPEESIAEGTIYPPVDITPIIDIDSGDYPVDEWIYDPGYQPPLVEHIDYDAYVSYDWYQYDIGQERAYAEQEAQCEAQVRSIILAILRAKLAYEKHGKIGHSHRSHDWHNRHASLRRAWAKAKAREKELAALRERHRRIFASRERVRLERERKLRNARQGHAWKELEKAKQRQVQEQRSEIVQRWLKEKKLREARAKIFKARRGAVTVNDRRAHSSGKPRIESISIQKQLEKRRIELARLVAEKKNREDEARANALRKVERNAREQAVAERVRAEVARKKASEERQERVRRDERRAKELAEQVRRKKAVEEAKRREEAGKAARDRDRVEAARKRAREESERQERARRDEQRKKELAEQARRKKASEEARRKKEELERAKREKAAREKAARERAERDRAKKAREERERQERVRREEQRKKELAEQARRKKAAEEARRKKEEQERAKREKAAREKAARERAEREKAERARKEREREERNRREEKRKKK